MAINQVIAPNSVPTVVGDYVAQNAHLMGFMTQVNMQAFVLTDPTTADKPKVALGSYIAHGGSLYKVEGADEAITGSPADGKVYVRVTGSATLSASFVSDISAYTYNHAYGSMTSGGYTLLPYVIIKSGNSWLKYRFDAVHKLQAETINTGQGDNLLYPMDQALRTTDSPTFVDLTLGTLKAMRVGTSEILSPSGTDVNISAMAVGELKYVSGDVTSLPASVKTPTANGTYLIIENNSVRVRSQNVEVADNGTYYLVIVRLT